MQYSSLLKYTETPQSVMWTLGSDALLCLFEEVNNCAKITVQVFVERVHTGNYCFYFSYESGILENPKVSSKYYVFAIFSRKILIAML